MDRKDFEQKIKRELKKLNNEQTVYFGWRCAVRALPFLGYEGSFDFWAEKDRKKHLYAVFYALDTNAAALMPSINGVFSDFLAAASEAFATDASAQAFAAARAADTYTATIAILASAYAVLQDAALAATAAAEAAQKNMNLESVILQDLSYIRDGRENQLNLTDSYGAIWDNFQKALTDEGCGYWGRAYQSIFESGLQVDLNGVRRRLTIPNEIREQGAAAVANFLQEIEEKGATRLNEARIIILGDKGAGKTCIARRLVNPQAPMTTDNESTAGVDTTLWELEREDINVRIWDFAGHTVTHAVHQFFLSESCLYLMVYDGRTEERNRLEYWLDHMKNYGGDSKAMILVNERDQHSVDIPINFLKEQYPIAGVYTFSIKDDSASLEAFRDDVAEYIKNNPSWEKQEIPTNYYQVKEELENLFVKGEQEKGLEHITKDMFEEIARRHDVKDAKKLLRDLHSLGVSLWYQDMAEFNTLVLNPEWISHGVYKIINWVSEAKKHTLALHELATVFKEDANRYAQDKHEFLFRLMKHYELAYQAEAGKELIIPHLLKEDRPASLPDFPVGESLMLRYKAEQPLPPNSISRFIVRHHQEIKKENKEYLVWRYGVVLEDSKGGIALVREDDRTISVSVKGRDKTNYISTLRETLNDIFKSYKSEKPELQYRLERFGQLPDEVEETNPLWLPDRKILNHHQRGKPYYDDVTDQDIPMGGIVNNYNINAANMMMGGRGNQLIEDKSTHFNFYDCNISLQSNLNELAQHLTEGGKKEEAKELENAAKALEQAEKIKSPEELKKKGLANRLKRLVEELENKDSKLNKTVKGIKNGISIAQDIAQGYNDIAQWAGLPQVPKPFLKE